MAVQGVIKAVLKGRLFLSIETRNIFYYGSQINSYSDYINSDYAAVDSAMDSIASILRSVCCSALNYYEFDLYSWDGEHWLLHVEVPIIDGEGLLTEEGLPSQVAILLKFATGAFRMIGHKYLAGVTEPSQEDGIVVGTVLTDLVDVGVEMMASIAVGGRVWYPGIPGKSSAFAPFTACIIHDVLSTMRRRKIGVGI